MTRQETLGRKASTEVGILLFSPFFDVRYVNFSLDAQLTRGRSVRMPQTHNLPRKCARARQSLPIGAAK